MSSSRDQIITIPEKQAKEISVALDRSDISTPVVLHCWGFEIVLWMNQGHTLAAYINDTSGG